MIMSDGRQLEIVLREFSNPDSHMAIVKTIHPRRANYAMKCLIFYAIQRGFLTPAHLLCWGLEYDRPLGQKITIEIEKENVQKDVVNSGH